MFVPQHPLPGINPEQGLAEHLNPAYWGGHTLGHGDTEPFPRTFIRHGEQGVRHLSVGIVPPNPIATYGPGDIFLTEGLEPGTQLFYQEEVLEGSALSAEELEACAALPIPASPSDKPPASLPDLSEFPNDVFHNYATDGDRLYASMVFSGLIVELGRTNNRGMLIGAPLYGGYRRPNGERVFYAGPSEAEEPVIVVGQTSHFFDPQTGRESIQRISKIVVSREGSWGSIEATAGQPPESQPLPV